MYYRKAQTLRTEVNTMRISYNVTVEKPKELVRIIYGIPGL